MFVNVALMSGDVLQLEVEADTTVLDLKESICLLKQVPCEHQTLMLGDMELQDEWTVSDCSMSPDNNDLCLVISERFQIRLHYDPPGYDRDSEVNQTMDIIIMVYRHHSIQDLKEYVASQTGYKADDFDLYIQNPGAGCKLLESGEVADYILPGSILHVNLIDDPE